MNAKCPNTEDWINNGMPLAQPLFTYQHDYTKANVISHSIAEFDINTLKQLNDNGGIRTVSDDVIYNGVDISGYAAVPLFNLETRVITGYRLANLKCKAAPIVVGNGIPACHIDRDHAGFFVATDSYPLFARLSTMQQPCVYHNKIDEAFKLVNNWLDASKPRLIATSSNLDSNQDLKFHVDADILKLSDQDINRLLLSKVATIQPTAKNPNYQLQIVSMAEVQAVPINWLWHGWLPLGKLTILAGAGGCGKTNLLLALIATISINGIFPDNSKCHGTGRILIYSTEDDAGDTLKPRLMANGADLGKIDFIAGRINDKGEREPFDPSQDLPLLRQYAQKHPDIKLLMIDPIISAVGGDSNKATDVRRALQVLVDFANEFNCAVVGITHFAKGTAGSTPAERIIGSQAFTALARMVWSAAKREDEGDCILVRAKSNISTLEGGIRYKLEADIVGDNIETTKTAWLGAIEGTARELLNDIESTENHSSAMDEAKEFLIDLLSPVESMPSKEVKKQYQEAGLSTRTIERASSGLKIVRFKPQGETAWHWKLPTKFHDAPAVLPSHKQTAYP